jgi:hypothetical protein
MKIEQMNAAAHFIEDMMTLFTEYKPTLKELLYLYYRVFDGDHVGLYLFGQEYIKHDNIINDVGVNDVETVWDDFSRMNPMALQMKFDYWFVKMLHKTNKPRDHVCAILERHGFMDYVEYNGVQILTANFRGRAVYLTSKIVEFHLTKEVDEMDDY